MTTPAPLVRRRKARRLTQLDLGEVSVVDVPANTGARHVLFKNLAHITGHDMAKGTTADIVGTAAGRICAQKCQALTNRRQSREDAATEICNQLIPDEFSRGNERGAAVFFKCREVCIELGAECDKKRSCNQ